MGPGTDTSLVKFKLAVLPLLPNLRPVLVTVRLLIG